MAKRHIPTADTKRQVVAWAMIGLNHELMARLVGIDAKTLRAHYREELWQGQARGLAEIHKAGFEAALTKGKDGDAMRIFTLKCRGRWRQSGPGIDDEFWQATAPKLSVRETLMRAYAGASSPQEAAACAGISMTELDEMRSQDPKFASECDRVAAQARAKMEATLRASALEGDTASLRMWLERRHPDFHPQTNTPAVAVSATDESADEVAFEYL